ncbi:MAG: hypothetical protein WDW38_005289 [Sanguina aurantia]
MRSGLFKCRTASEAPAPASSEPPSEPPSPTVNEGSSNGHTTSISQPEPPTPWLDALVPIPLSGGYRTRRRDILKVLPLAVAASCLAVVATRSKAFSYTSPAAILAAFVTPPSGPDPDSTPSSDTSRVDAYVRYIAGIEKRGGGQEVPDFQRYGDWINSGPLSMGKELKGKVLVLDFWTLCCINCMHVLPELAALESKYKGLPVAVVGVHSAKFDNEKDSDAIRNAVLRYDVTHAVVNDSRMQLWGALGVSSWPTLAMVSPRGRVLAMLSGEGHRRDVDDFLAAALRYYGDLGMLDNSPLPLALERDKDPGAATARSPLRYPGKLAVDAAGGRLFISDSNNHRVVITTLDGDFIDQIGGGAPLILGNGAALTDGLFEGASFNRPQGLAYSAKRHCLYIADTESHALRCADLSSRTVSTLAGDGSQGGDYAGGGRGAGQRLSSPWAVAMDATEGAVYVAMAGTHQIWRHDVGDGATSRFSGTGNERNQNGPTGLTTSWAQPSGLSLSPDGRSMFVADSESSTIRQLDLSSGGANPLAGGDPLFSDNLFKFGDVDGVGFDALLQHPLGVCVGEGGEVFIADSYNHRIKVLDPVTRRVTTLAGNGQPGLRDGPTTSSQLSEPSGLSLGPNNTLYVADTNNSTIRVLRPAPGQRSYAGGPGRDVGSAVLTTLLLKGGELDASEGGGALLRAESAVGASGGRLTVRVQLPVGYHLTEGAGSGFEAVVMGAKGSTGGADAGVVLRSSTGLLSPVSEVGSGAGSGGASVVEGVVEYTMRDAAAAEGARVRVAAKIYFCLDGGVCLFERKAFEFSFSPAMAGDVADAVVTHLVSAPAPSATLSGGLEF